LYVDARVGGGGDSSKGAAEEQKEEEPRRRRRTLEEEEEEEPRRRRRDDTHGGGAHNDTDGFTNRNVYQMGKTRPHPAKRRAATVCDGQEPRGRSKHLPSAFQ
jgi:hypothetical protein